MLVPCYRWHSTAVLVALGMDTITMSFTSSQPVIKSDEVMHWPNVVWGVFSTQEALETFDRHFVNLPLDGETIRGLMTIHTC